MNNNPATMTLNTTTMRTADERSVGMPDVFSL
jgi:hypothetical protein